MAKAGRLKDVIAQYDALWGMRGMANFETVTISALVKRARGGRTIIMASNADISAVVRSEITHPRTPISQTTSSVNLDAVRTMIDAPARQTNLRKSLRDCTMGSANTVIAGWKPIARISMAHNEPETPRKCGTNIANNAATTAAAIGRSR
ncbi:hypothetical protein TUM20983_45580 [Mycobacterium antarcticum]|nr:hypothetical protein TUM20983_45580 [Mycolicibacterium sp. TUM20983]